jgi:glycosyltransferase involved in cell wall biosynthesis
VIKLIKDKYDQIKSVSIIIPTLNEIDNIKYVFPRIPEFIDEIVVIDGDSDDGTREEILKFRKDAKIIIYRTNGKGAALRKGFDIVTGDLIIMMDADGSHNPDEIPSLLKPILNGYDVVKASRFLPGGGSDDFTPFRRMGNIIFIKMVNKLYGANYTDLCYGYRVFKKEAIMKIPCKSDGFEIETEQSILIQKAGLRIKEVPSFESKRKHGNSNLNSIRDGWRILRTIVKEKF